MPGFIFKDLFRYVAMPEIMPRLRELLFGGLGYVPFFIAVVYQMVGLLPRNHPYIMQRNIGRFGIRHVLAEAANNIRFDLKHLDQIVLYFAVLVGIVIFIIQLLALGVAFVFQPAIALPTTFAGFFVVPIGNRPHDLAFMMLDMVFGVPHPSITIGAGAGGPTGFFESCVGNATICLLSDATNISAMGDPGPGPFTAAMADHMGPLAPNAYTAFPFPFHLGLHAILQFYSSGLLVIAVGMTAYFVVTVIGETTQTGTPFGKRFNKTWAPLRIVVAFGLLMPMAVGLNSAQYIVLYAAKWGSGFATNGWTYFNSTLSTSYTGDYQRLVSMPNMPDMDALAQFMFTARTCKYIADYYLLKESRRLAKEAGLAPGAWPTTLPNAYTEPVYAFVLMQDTMALPNYIPISPGTDYGMVMNTVPSNTVNLKVRFGVRDPDKYTEYHASVKPVCGDISIPLIDGRPCGMGATCPNQERYLAEIQRAYFELVRDMWNGSFWNGIAGGPAHPAYSHAGDMFHRYRYYAERNVTGLPDCPVPQQNSNTGTHVNHTVGLDQVYVQNVKDEARDRIQTVANTAIGFAQTSSLWGGPYTDTAGLGASETAVNDPLYSRGWVGAGIWYNRIAQINGQLTDALSNVPTVVSYPEIMETVASKKILFSNFISPENRYEPTAAAIDDLGLLLDQANGEEFATALYKAHLAWTQSASVQAQHPSGNPILLFISHILGLDGLYNMRDNENNVTSTHPLAKLSGVGRSLVESSIRSLGYAAGASIFGTIGPVPEQFMYVISSFFITTAMLGLTVGFVLFYILPFLPFIYFFFAAGGWIKGIFEAMVGAPLWALAHIRIDSHGLPGNAAMNGYFLIFEVFLRPILIVFGMLASISIFAAMVNALDSIFDLVVQNAAGYDMASQIADGTFSGRYMRSLVDQFFFLVIYTIVVYMIGMSSFKLIDLIPNNILRWMGQSVSTFGDTRDDPAQGLTSRATMGSQQVLGKLGGGLDSMARAARDAKG